MNPTASGSPSNEILQQEIAIHAPATRVFAALTDPRQRLQWWGDGQRFRLLGMDSDLRPGGPWEMRFTGMDGNPVSVRGEYREIDPPRVLSFTWLPGWQGDTTVSLVRFELAESGGITTVRLTHSGLITEASRASHRGWPFILEWLRAYIEGGSAPTSAPGGAEPLRN